jgi:hypothetical protein
MRGSHPDTCPRLRHAEAPELFLGRASFATKFAWAGLHVKDPDPISGTRFIRI